MSFRPWLNWFLDRLWPRSDAPFDEKRHDNRMQTEIRALLAEADRLAEDEGADGNDGAEEEGRKNKEKDKIEGESSCGLLRGLADALVRSAAHRAEKSIRRVRSSVTLSDRYQDERQSEVTEDTGEKANDEQHRDEHVKKIQDVLREACDSEWERRKSIDARLNTLAGLAAAGSALLSSTAASKIQQPSSPISVVIAISIVYILVQLCAAAWHAIRGLSAMDSDALLPKELLRGERDHKAFATSLVTEYTKCRYSLLRVCDEKVTRMSCAYTALLNVVVAACFGGVLVAVGVVAAEPSGDSDEILMKLRADPDLLRLLTGPSGGRGEPGPAGPPGPPGRPGRDGRDARCESPKEQTKLWWSVYSHPSAPTQ